MNTQKLLYENISALADGELATSEIELAFAALGTTDGQAAWDAYHQIGHTLRSHSAELSGDFSARLASRLALENPLRHAPGERQSVTHEDGANLQADASISLR